MAYAGATSTSPNTPVLIAQGIGSTWAGGRRTWMYKSTHTQVAVSTTGNFFTDGQALGMQLGDIVLVQGSTTYVQSQHTVILVGSTGVGLSAGLLVSSAS